MVNYDRSVFGVPGAPVTTNQNFAGRCFSIDKNSFGFTRGLPGFSQRQLEIIQVIVFSETPQQLGSFKQFCEIHFCSELKEVRIVIPPLAVPIRRETASFRAVVEYSLAISCDTCVTI